MRHRTYALWLYLTHETSSMITRSSHNGRMRHLDLRLVVPFIALCQNSFAPFSERSLYLILARLSSTVCNSPLAPSTFCFIYGKRSFKRGPSLPLETQRALRAQEILWLMPLGIYWISGGTYTTARGQYLTDSRHLVSIPSFPPPRLTPPTSI